MAATTATARETKRDLRRGYVGATAGAVACAGPVQLLWSPATLEGLAQNLLCKGDQPAHLLAVWGWAYGLATAIDKFGKPAYFAVMGFVERADLPKCLRRGCEPEAPGYL